MICPADNLSTCLLIYLLYVFILFFFFQAEDGIRDLTVTGVQTCALPISRPQRPSTALQPAGPRSATAGAPRAPAAPRPSRPERSTPAPRPARGNRASHRDRKSVV